MSDGLNREGFEDGPYAGLSAYGIAVTALERILELDTGWMSWDEARAELETAMALALQDLIDEDDPQPQPAPGLAAAMGEARGYRERLNAIRKPCEARLRVVGMVDGKGVAKKVIAIIDKPEAGQ